MRGETISEIEVGDDRRVNALGGAVLQAISVLNSFWFRITPGMFVAMKD